MRFRSCASSGRSSSWGRHRRKQAPGRPRLRCLPTSAALPINTTPKSDHRSSRVPPQIISRSARSVSQALRPLAAARQPHLRRPQMWNASPPTSRSPHLTLMQRNSTPLPSPSRPAAPVLLTLAGLTRQVLRCHRWRYSPVSATWLHPPCHLEPWDLLLHPIWWLHRMQWWPRLQLPNSLLNICNIRIIRSVN